MHADAPKPDRRVRVSTGASSYDVLVGTGLLSLLDHFLSEVARPARALVVRDANLSAESVHAATASLQSSGIQTVSLTMTADERRKSMASVEEIIRAAIALRLERDEPFIALGGGIVGDVAGFAAASYRRGVPIIQCPSTLLSMVDASVGGKTGVNIEVPDAAGTAALKKNMAGAFHQPLMVVCDIELLRTLPARELRSGIAECIKHGLIGADFGDPRLAEFTQANAAAILALDEPLMIDLIARNIAVKAAAVGEDPFERAASTLPHGGRMALNCGHTVAHAIETLPGIVHSQSGQSGLTHGEAVGLGLLAECRLAVALQLQDPSAPQRLSAMLASVGLPTQVRGLPPAVAIANAMLDDKKVAAGTLRLALPCQGNHCRLITDPPRDAVLAAIDSVRAD